MEAANETQFGTKVA